MIFPRPLTEAILLRRYKRFLADVRLANGETVTVHTANTGSMLGCAEPGSRVWLSRSDNPARKYALSWEIVETAPGVLVGINTALPNRLVQEAIENGVLCELQGYDRIRTEVPFGSERSRVDLLLERDADAARCYVEIKNVTASLQPGIALFPDAVSARGSKHLRELAAVVAGGQRAVLCFCVQRGDVSEVRPADSIDALYGATLRQAIHAGVEVIAWRADVSPAGIALRERLTVACPPL
jgi:sugar fermentation stimulation protein A